MDRLYMFIATGAGSGYLPSAPGTWGSLAGLFLWYLLRPLPQRSLFIAIVVLFVLGVVAAGAAEKITDRPDPGLVVIDEVVGQLIVLTALPALEGYGLLFWPTIAFLLFRFFDILKPFPVGWLDHHIHGGLGIMLDDAAAGLLGWLVLRLLFQII